MKRYIQAAIKDISEEDEQYQFFLAQSGETSPRILEQLFELNEGSININLARNPKLPADLAVKLARWDGPGFLEVLSKLSRNPATSGEALAIITEVPNITSAIQYHLAGHPNLPVSVQHAFVDSYDPDVRFGLTENPNLNVSVMRELAEDGNYDVRSELAAREDLPLEVIQKLSDDSVDGVREFLAGNSTIPEDVIIKLSKDSDHMVLYYLAGNDNTPTDILQWLCSSEHPATRKHAKENLERRGLHVDVRDDA